MGVNGKVNNSQTDQKDERQHEVYSYRRMSRVESRDVYSLVVTIKHFSYKKKKFRI